MTNNIINIEAFIKKEAPNCLILNHINEDIDLVYIYIFEYFARKYQVRINQVYDIDELFNGNDDLFQIQPIKFLKTSSQIKVNKILDSKINCILITDYKIFKKFNTKGTIINGYNYKNDLKKFLEIEIQINNFEFINHIINNPAMIFSEISKYDLNQNKFEKFFSNQTGGEDIAQIRSKIFELKRDKNADIQQFYKLIIEETYIKKFNFLTS